MESLLAIDFQTSDSLKTTITSSVFVALSQTERRTDWGIEREIRRRDDEELEEESFSGGGLGGNRSQIIRLHAIQSVIESDPFSIWDMESSEVVLTGGTFNSGVTNNIAIYSTSAEISSDDPDSSSVPKLSLSDSYPTFYTYYFY